MKIKIENKTLSLNKSTDGFAIGKKEIKIDDINKYIIYNISKLELMSYPILLIFAIITHPLVFIIIGSYLYLQYRLSHIIYLKTINGTIIMKFFNTSDKVKFLNIMTKEYAEFKDKKYKFFKLFK